MKLLFVHRNFPGQFRHLAEAFARQDDCHVAALHMREDLPDRVQGIDLHTYRAPRGAAAGVHPWLLDMESKTIRGEAAAQAASTLRAGGYEPDVIVGHPGWGEMLFLRDIWPAAKMGVYCEHYHDIAGASVGFDPECAVADPLLPSRVRYKNLHLDLTLECAMAGFSPTHAQARTFPDGFRERITVVHPGVDTARLAPDPDTRVRVNDWLTLSRTDEVVVFAPQALDPEHGFHMFMRALPALLRSRPKAQMVIVGKEMAGRGGCSHPADWKRRMTDEVAPSITREDWSRVHFMGSVDPATLNALLRLSSVYVHLAYPFVLAPRLVEAMSLGCAIVASDTPPVREAIDDGETGILTDFLDHARLAERVGALLADGAQREKLSAAARDKAIATFDLRRVALPQAMRWVTDTLAA